MPMILGGSGTINTSSSFAVAVGGTEDLRIDSSGNIGIGTTTPAELLSVTGNIRLQTANSRVIGFNSTSPYVLNSSGGASVFFNTLGDGSQEIGFETHHLGNSHLERMRITKEGYVRKPYTPAFSVSRSGTGNQTTDHTVPFDVVHVNNGNGFNTSTYRYTAPVTGLYYIFMHAMNHQTNAVGVATIHLFINGSRWGYFHIINSHPTSASKPHILTLNAGDYIYMNASNYHYNSDSYRYPTFGAYFIG